MQALTAILPACKKWSELGISHSNSYMKQGYGSATRFWDCRTKNKTYFELVSIASRVRIFSWSGRLLSRVGGTPGPPNLCGAGDSAGGNHGRWNRGLRKLWPSRRPVRRRLRSESATRSHGRAPRRQYPTARRNGAFRVGPPPLSARGLLACPLAGRLPLPYHFALPL